MVNKNTEAIPQNIKLLIEISMNIIFFKDNIITNTIILNRTFLKLLNQYEK